MFGSIFDAIHQSKVEHSLDRSDPIRLDGKENGKSLIFIIFTLNIGSSCGQVAVIPLSEFFIYFNVVFTSASNMQQQQSDETTLKIKA